MDVRCWTFCCCSDPLWRAAQHLDRHVPNRWRIFWHGMRAGFRARDKRDGLALKTMNRLNTVIAAGEQTKPVGQSSVVARVQNRRHPSQFAALVAGLLPELPSRARLERFTRLAVTAGKNPKPGRVQSGFVVAQLQQCRVVIAQQNHASDGPHRLRWN